MKKEGKKRNAYEQKRKENKIGSNSALRRTLKATANEHTGCGTHVIFTQLVVLCAPYRRNSATICHHTPCKSTHCRASNGGKIITIPTNSNNETSTITIWRRDWCCVWVVLVALLLFAAQQLYSILGTSEALVFGEWSEGRTTDTTHLIVQWKVGAFVSPVLLGCMCAGGMQNKNAVGFCWRLMRSLNTSQSYSTLLFGCCLFIIPLGMPTVMYIFLFFPLLSHAGKGLFYHLPPPPKKKRGSIFCVCRIYSTFFPHRIIFFLVCLCQATRNSPNENNALRYPVPPPLTGYILYSPKAAGVTFWEIFEKLQKIVCFSCISSNISVVEDPSMILTKTSFRAEFETGWRLLR